MNRKDFKPATLGGKEYALQKLQERIKDNAGTDWDEKTRDLPAGAPMFFGCVRCNAKIEVSENYLERPTLCDECQALKDCGWLENSTLRIAFVAKMNRKETPFLIREEEGRVLLAKLLYEGGPPEESKNPKDRFLVSTIDQEGSPTGDILMPYEGGRPLLDLAMTNVRLLKVSTTAKA